MMSLQHARMVGAGFLLYCSLMLTPLPPVALSGSRSHCKRIWQRLQATYLQHAHVDVDDLVIEPIEAAQAAQQPPRHLDVAWSVVCNNLISCTRPQCLCSLRKKILPDTRHSQVLLVALPCIPPDV